MISILDRYIIKKFLGTYVFSIALIISIAVVFDINEQLDKFLKKDAPLPAIIFDYYVNFVPYFANLFSSLFVFISVIFFTSKLANNSEIIAMLSNGMSFKRLMKPYMISAAIISIVSFLMSGFVIPPANAKRIDFQNKYIKDKSVDWGSKIQIQVEPGVIAFMETFDNKEGSGRNFSLDKFDDKELVSRLTAKTIEYDSGFHWVIKDYSIRNFVGMRETIINGKHLDTTLQVTPQDFLIAVNDFEKMTTPQLYQHIKKQKDRGIGNVQSFEIEFHSRFASIASAFILTIIGASLSSRKIKGGMGLNIGIGLLLSVSYILFMTISSTFAVSGLMSPLVAAWFPNFVFAFVAAFVYRKAPN
ncbi:lipopolysaccharide export system permease protein [Dysgonomonas sp. PH5-45]|uniref:LptF/LptG family permease n=1 Tax=unclassified Dysgonomonas TaxID=2630389 RepID=UPI002476880B|nr:MULTISPECIES: LptF/LptG family permease [unclassified Dysgonomonas]MDH6354275.1 lipopolysaccharide export system permease protein [Dysgonomonas sp. PH5-45]MDH6387176.1 lipopolysaccharide export system permease protein [Dysgonomonas sp. PH5-37]